MDSDPATDIDDAAEDPRPVRPPGPSVLRWSVGTVLLLVALWVLHGQYERYVLRDAAHSAGVTDQWHQDHAEYAISLLGSMWDDPYSADFDYTVTGATRREVADHVAVTLRERGGEVTVDDPEHEPPDPFAAGDAAHDQDEDWGQSDEPNVFDRAITISGATGDTSVSVYVFDTTPVTVSIHTSR